ncbi:hypothetical protein B1R94_17655 [Mycolicibacterium litorale]|nr:hypothetical protein B1R94_17655 [Mycolicibacterium litorale]
MSREFEHGWAQVPPPRPTLAPMAAGFLGGLVSMAATPFVYYWLFVPVIPAFVGFVAMLLSIKVRELWPVVEGFFAATLFGILFVAVAFGGLSSIA